MWALSQKLSIDAAFKNLHTEKSLQQIIVLPKNCRGQSESSAGLNCGGRDKSLTKLVT
jgi:hypothetical protein